MSLVARRPRRKRRPLLTRHPLPNRATVAAEVVNRATVAAEVVNRATVVAGRHPLHRIRLLNRVTPVEEVAAGQLPLTPTPPRTPTPPAAVEEAAAVEAG